MGERAALRPRRGGRAAGRARGSRTCSTCRSRRPGRRATSTCCGSSCGCASCTSRSCCRSARRCRRAGAATSPRSCEEGARAGEFTPVAAPDEVADRLVAHGRRARLRDRARLLVDLAGAHARAARALRAGAARPGVGDRLAPIALRVAARDMRARLGGHVVAESLAALGATRRLRRARRPRAVDLGRAARRAAADARAAHGAVRRLRRRRLRARERPAGAAAPLHRPGRAQLADRADGGGHGPRARRGHLEPGAARADRPRARIPARAARPARRLRPGGQARRGAPRAPKACPSCSPRPGARRSRRPPDPTYLEIPVDVLEAPAAVAGADGLDGAPPPPARGAPGGRRGRRRACWRAAERPVLWAGGGVERSGAWAELRGAGRAARRARRHDVHGQGRVPGRPSARASAPAATRRRCGSCSQTADVVLAVGTELGAETTGQYGSTLLRPAAAPRRRAGADRGDVPGARPRRRRARDARGAGRRRAGGRARRRRPRGGRPRADRPRARRRRPARSSAACWPTSPRPPAPTP